MICAVVTAVQTCALPILPGRVGIHPGRVQAEVAGVGLPAGGEQHRVEGFRDTGDAHAAGAGALECGHVVLQAQRDAGLAVVLLQPLDPPPVDIVPHAPAARDPFAPYARTPTTGTASWRE